MTILAPHPSELHPEFLSNNSVDPWVDVNSGPRKVMMSGHLPQALTIRGSEERYWQTGTEARFGEYTFAIKAPVDMEIFQVIHRFPKSRVFNSTIKNPQTIVIYIDENTREVGCLDFSDFNVEHQYFGFEYVKTEAYHRIRKGEVFAKDTPFLISPSIKDGGGYGMGTNLNFVTMSHPAVSDDAMMISKSALKKMSFDLVETRVASWGQSSFGLNLFGDHENVKMFRDVGEKIRPDGLLFASREYDEYSAVTSLGLWDTQMLDMTYDEKLYTRPGDGTIYDIMVYHDNRSLPNGMNTQVEKYRDLTDRFYREILEAYHTLKARYNGRIKLTDEFHRMVVEAAAMTDYDIDQVVQMLFHKAPIDDWRVMFKIKYHITPNIGNKVTGFAGDKGILCTVVDDEDMPTNDRGVRADVVMSPDSPVNRQNNGGMYEPYFNQVTRDFLVVVREKLDLGPEEEPSQKELEVDMARRPEVYERVWSDLIRLYGILSPAMYAGYTESKFDEDQYRALHLSWRLKFKAMHILSPTDNATPWRAAVNACEREFPPFVSPLTYRGYSGKMVRTKTPIEIGYKYFMLLEKISDDWIAVSTAKVQHLQVLGQVTSSDKYSNPAKTQAVKAISEAELRIILSFCGGEVAANLLDQNNSLPTHSAFVYSILDTKTPTNIERAVDRTKIPLGGNRALKLFKHILDTNGYKFVYNRYRDPDIAHRDAYIDKDRETIIKIVIKPVSRAGRAVRNAGRNIIKFARGLFMKKDD